MKKKDWSKNTVNAGVHQQDFWATDSFFSLQRIQLISILIRTIKITLAYTAWKVFVFGIFLVRIFPHSHRIRIDSSYTSHLQNSCEIETGLSDFHKMVITVMKTTFQNLKSKLIFYRDYSMFSNDKSREELLSKLSMENISNTSNGL